MTNLLFKKRRGNRLLSIPRTEALALPNPVEQTTPEPTPYEMLPHDKPI